MRIVTPSCATFLLLVLNRYISKGNTPVQQPEAIHE